MYLNITTPKAAYRFALYHTQTRFNRIAGIYAFLILPPHPDFDEPSPETIQTFHHLLYIGITNNFQTRLNHHHKLPQAIQLGITHIGILKKSSGRKRKTIERDLLQSLNPPLNQTWLTDLHIHSPPHLT